MHNFRKTVCFVLALILGVLVLYSAYTAPYFYATAYYYQDGEARDELSGELNLLISGSSHAFRAFVPERIDSAMGTSSYNLACSMQTMAGRYYLLQKELERNPVKTVIIELSYNSLTRDRAIEGPEGDIYQLGRLRNPLQRWDYFFSQIRPSEYGDLYYDTMDRSTTAWKKLIKGEMGLQSVRGYLGLEPVDQSLPEKDREQVAHTKQIPLTKNPESVLYFEKSVELCLEKGIRVILVTTPMPERTVLEHEDLETIRIWYEEYARQYGCEFYDFNLRKTRQTDYPGNTAFYDLSHLSQYGAQTFTDDLCRILQKAERGESVSELFYSDYDVLFQALMTNDS